MGGSNGEDRLVDRATAYGTEVSTEKSKIMTNGTNNISVDISIRPEVREGDQFEVHASNPVQRWHLLSRSPHQDCLRNDSNGQTKQDLAVQHHQLRREVQSLQVSCHPRSSSMAVKHGPCLLTLKKQKNKTIQLSAFGTKCMGKLLRISYLEHKTNGWARSKINFLVGPQEPLPATGKRRKHAWFGHVTRRNSLSQTILQGTLEDG